MGFREPLPLDLKDYEWVFKEFAGEEGEDNEGLLPEVPVQRNPTAPYQVGNGPTTASTCTALALIYPPAHCWDSNGWYALLGVNHRATRKQLKDAYLNYGGADSDRMTYAITMLLDPAIRYEYDMLGCGEYWIDDPHWQEWIKKRAAAESARLKALGHCVTPETLLQQWGLELGPPPPEFPEDSPPVLLDSDLNYRDNSIYTGWYYSWFAWRVNEKVFAELAEAWQQALIRAAKGAVLPLTVGVMESTSPYSIQEVDGRLVVFIASDANPIDHAESALQTLSLHLKGT